MNVDVPATQPTKSPWNSLEISKLLVGALTPILIFWYGQQITAEKDKVAEAREKASQVVKKRVELWDKLAGRLNDLYCYYLFIGHWKAISPDLVLAKKRELDNLMYSYRPFFSDEFFGKYENYMSAMFKTYRGWGKDAALRTRPIRPGDAKADPSGFTNEDNSKEVYGRYFELLRFAAKEFDLYIPAAGSGSPPKTPQSADEIRGG